MASSHTLTFSRLRANFIVDKELIGKQDPYVIFQSGSAKTQTKAIKGVGTGTAEWKESYTLESFSPKSSSVVEVTVYNHNHLLPDAVIGSGQVDLSNQGQSSLSGSGEPISVILVDKKGQEVGTVQFVTNGGGYSGRSGTGTGSGVGTGSGTGVGTGSSYGSHSGTGSGLGSAAGAGAAGAAGGALVGKGVGSDARTAQHASDKAAREGRDVTIEGRDRVGVGHPTSATGSHSHSGVGSGTGSAVGAAAGAATGHHGHHSGTGPAVGAAAGATPGHHGHHSGTGSAVGAAADAATGHHGHHHGHHSGTGITGSETGVAGSRGVQEGVTGTGVTSGSAVDRDTVYGVKEGDVIDRKYYVGQDSRPQDQALVEQYREHNPYAKDYETTVQHTGRERLVNSQIEALGTRERVIGQDHQVQSHPHHEIARHLPAGAIDQRPGGEGWVQTKPGPVCDTNTFSISGNRTVDKERVTDLREHRDFEKEFEVKTRLVGERALDRGTDAEILNRERVLVDEKNKIACEGHPTATAEGGATLASQGQGVGTGTGYGSSSTGTGAGYGSGTTGAGYGQGQGQGRSTTGEKIAGVIPGTEENSDKKQGYRPGQGPDQNQGNVTAGEKAASYIPGSTENKEKKAGYA